jgi:CRISPR-associated protein Csb2
MPDLLCITVRFLQPYSHGRGDQGVPEWPPSPLRLFQALANSAAARWNERVEITSAAPSLRWLERQGGPIIIAGAGLPSKARYRLYVPDNVADKVAASWSRGREASIADYRAEKDVQATNLPDGPDAVHYLWPLTRPDSGFETHKDILFAAARSITHLGWGVDMVAAHASVLSDVEVERLQGERWHPTDDASASGLRVPVDGTLDDLIARHHAFLNRITPEGSFAPVPPLSAFRVVGYRRATEPSHRPFAAFSLLKPDASGNRPFDPVRRTRDVAGMLRSAVSRVAHDQGWPDERINVFIHGKTPDGAHPASGAVSPDRFQYLPLPTINSTLHRVEATRRVLIAAPAGCREPVAWARRAMAGEFLIDEQGQPSALLTILPGSDWVLRQYVGESATWSTVTPVILPGFDDRQAAKAARLLGSALAQAGFSKQLIDQSEIEWRQVGFRAGVDLASRYLPPKNISQGSRYHVRVRFPHSIRGPFAIGSGRFRGFGVFAVSETW